LRLEHAVDAVERIVLAVRCGLNLRFEEQRVPVVIGRGVLRERFRIVQHALDQPQVVCHRLHDALEIGGVEIERMPSTPDGTGGWISSLPLLISAR
jgi:hypothetical protein